MRAIDVILSNCVINLSPEKPAVFREAFRVLQAGRPARDQRRRRDRADSDRAAHAGRRDSLAASSGAAPLDDVRAMLAQAGFIEVEVKIAPRSAEIVESWLPGTSSFVASATIEARKPGGVEEPTACCGPGCCA